MKTKRTIRKLKSPLARDIARMARSAALLEKRLDAMALKVEEQAFELRMARKEINALHNGEMMPQSTALASAVSVREELFPEDQPDSKRSQQHEEVQCN